MTFCRRWALTALEIALTARGAVYSGSVRIPGSDRGRYCLMGVRSRSSLWMGWKSACAQGQRALGGGDSR
jgi:hypothetical protein